MIEDKNTDLRPEGRGEGAGSLTADKKPGADAGAGTANAQQGRPYPGKLGFDSRPVDQHRDRSSSRMTRRPGEKQEGSTTPKGLVRLLSTEFVDLVYHLLALEQVPSTHCGAYS